MIDFVDTVTDLLRSRLLRLP